MDGLMFRAIEEKMPLEMIYLSGDQQISQRKLIIKEVNGEYIRAFCLLRKQMRTFRRDSILSLLPPKQKRYLH